MSATRLTKYNRWTSPKVDQIKVAFRPVSHYWKTIIVKIQSHMTAILYAVKGFFVNEFCPFKPSHTDSRPWFLLRSSPNSGSWKSMCVGGGGSLYPCHVASHAHESTLTDAPRITRDSFWTCWKNDTWVRRKWRALPTSFVVDCIRSGEVCSSVV